MTIKYLDLPAKAYLTYIEVDWEDNKQLALKLWNELSEEEREGWERCVEFIKDQWGEDEEDDVLNRSADYYYDS